MYSAASHRLVSITAQQIAVLDADTCQEVVSFRVGPVQDGVGYRAASEGDEVECYVHCVQWSPSGGLLAAILKDYQARLVCGVHVYKIASGQCVHSLPLAGYIQMQWSPVADLLAVWGSSLVPRAGAPVCEARPPDVAMDVAWILDPRQKETRRLAVEPPNSAQESSRNSSDYVDRSPCGNILLAWRQGWCVLVVDPKSGQSIPGAESIRIIDTIKSSTAISWAPSPSAGQAKKLAEAFIAPRTMMRIQKSGASWRAEATEHIFQPPCDGLESSCLSPNGRSIVSWQPFSNKASSLYHYDLGTRCVHTLIPAGEGAFKRMDWP